MNVQERQVLDLFGQRLDDHIRSCENIHVDIKTDIRDMSRKVDDVKDITSKQAGGTAAISWMLLFGVAVSGALLTAAGIIAGVIIGLMAR